MIFMKRIYLIALVFTLGVACVDKDKEKVSQLEVQLDETVTMLEERDSAMNEYLGFITEIEKNLNEIRERESLISLESGELQGDNQEQRDQLIKDLQTINTLMAENKERITTLSNSLKGSKYQINKLKELVSELQKNMEIKAEEIEKLNQQMAFLTEENLILKVQVDSLFAENETKNQTIQEQNDKIKQLDDKFHTAYYASGSLEDLKAKSIIEKEGGFLGIGSVKQLNENLNFSELDSIDIRNTYSIPIHSKKVELVTEHPTDSYEMIMDEDKNQVDKILIIDPDKFWASTKCLVMITK
jgi:DNA repair exonuclease SbcCD ATPase subunit